jgi:hypothetical protein
MKNITYIKDKLYILILVIFINFSVFSQEDQVNILGFNLNSEQENTNLLNNINLFQLSPNINGSSTQDNNILIQQIGNYNRVFSQTQSQSSEIELIQYGDFNEIDLSINAPSISGKIIQNGNSNSILNSIYYTNLNVNLNAQQNGNNLTINKIGINSLSNSLQINQQGSFKSITIISN